MLICRYRCLYPTLAIMLACPAFLPPHQDDGHRQPVAPMSQIRLDGSGAITQLPSTGDSCKHLPPVTPSTIKPLPAIAPTPPPDATPGMAGFGGPAEFAVANKSAVTKTIKPLPLHIDLQGPAKRLVNPEHRAATSPQEPTNQLSFKPVPQNGMASKPISSFGQLETPAVQVGAAASIRIGSPKPSVEEVIEGISEKEVAAVGQPGPVFQLATPPQLPASGAQKRFTFEVNSPSKARLSMDPGELDSPTTVQIPTAPPVAKPQPETVTAQRAAQSELWWEALVNEPLDARPVADVSLDGLIQLALLNSPRILAISTTPLVQETEIGVARAEFDPGLFVRSRYDDRVDPATNLTQGAFPFLKDNLWAGDAGVRRKLYSGAELELAQKLGFHNSNNQFFVPQDQGTATLALSFSQPLLRGRGQYVNRSQIMIAQLERGVAWNMYSVELQQELMKIVEAYWSLYNNRGILLQKQRNVSRGQDVLKKLEARAGLDSLPSQIARARAAVLSRQTEVAVAIRDVRNAETELRRLVASQGALDEEGPQLVPSAVPNKELVPLELKEIISSAIENRPEVTEVMKEAKIAAVERNVSRNALLPELTMVVDTYVSALEGDSEIGTAWVNQFTDVTPGFAAGLEFALPVGNRAAKSRLTRHQLELRRIRFRTEQVLLDVVAEAKIAWRQVVTAHQTMLAAQESILAAAVDLRQNEVRYQSFALVEGDLADGHTPTTLLDQLLEAQQRLTTAESTYSQSLTAFKIAEVELRKATGTLLLHEPLDASFGSSSVHPLER